jgi:phage host-nuclease inhibitor protein Gam
MIPAKINDWNDADQVLGVLASLRRDRTALAATRDEAIHKAKDQYVRAAQPLDERIESLEAELHRFTLAHQDELEGRSRKLEHGRLGFLLVHELRVRSVKRAIAWLIEAKKMAYVRVKHELNREALYDAPNDVKQAIGARVKSFDEFWYEVDGERHAVEG